jgi:hypothetical protein
MTSSFIFTIFSIAALLAMAMLVVFIFKKGRNTRPTPLTFLAFTCTLAGLFIGSANWIGYALMALGVLLAFLDISRRSKSR